MNKKLLIGPIILIVVFITATTYLRNVNQKIISEGPISETIKVSFGEEWSNERHDEYYIFFCYSGILLDHYVFAPIQMGAWQAWSYNVFIDQKRFSMRGIDFYIIKADPQYIIMRVTYPHDEPFHFILILYFVVPLTGLMIIVGESILNKAVRCLR